MAIDRSELVVRAKEIILAEAQAIRSLADQVDENIASVVDLLLRCQGHVLVAGAGTSNAMARRFAHLLSCTGTPALHISAADGIHGGSGAIKPGDVVYLISKGGRSAEINRFADIARRRGARVIAQTENPESPLGQMSDAVFNVRTAGDVDPYGLIATGSSLVNGAACDALCVLLLELQGHSREDFGVTHPGGAVGMSLAEEQEKSV